MQQVSNYIAEKHVEVASTDAKLFVFQKDHHVHVIEFDDVPGKKWPEFVQRTAPGRVAVTYHQDEEEACVAFFQSCIKSYLNPSWEILHVC